MKTKYQEVVLKIYENLCGRIQKIRENYHLDGLTDSEREETQTSDYILQEVSQKASELHDLSQRITDSYQELGIEVKKALLSMEILSALKNPKMVEEN